MSDAEPISVQVRRVKTRQSSISRIGIARAIAIAADILQLTVFPFFFEGALSPLDVALDALVAALLTWLVGWHIAFLPSMVAELIPFVDLAPTWTIAVFIATSINKDARYVAGDKQ